MNVYRCVPGRLTGPTSTVAAVAVLFATLAGGPAYAADCDMAEKLRLSEEAKKLAQRNAWSGVERSFEGLLATKCELKFDQYELGAQAARYLGKTHEMYERLAAAKDIDPQPQILDALSGLDGNYGRVDIKGDPRRRPVLARGAMPFAPDQRKSIEYAVSVVEGTGSFHGMLPIGDYTVNDIAFTVETGEEWQVIEVGKSKGGGKGGGGEATVRPESEGFINYAGLVATVGPNFMLTGAPASPIEDGENLHQFAPDDIFSSGVSVQLGTELGLTYAAPEAGIAFLVGYAGGFGNDTLHDFSGSVAGVLRPGQLRIAIGPQYAFVTGKGTGVAEWFDVGHDQSRDPNAGIRYQGLSWGGGAQASIGYGFLDFDTMRGGVELAGNWLTDGSRSFMGFGLRVGVFPAVPRFEG